MHRPATGDVLLQTPTAWRLYRAPWEVLTTSDLGQVGACITRLEAAVTGGAWAVGWLAYEAAPAFDGALRTRPPAGPLLWFGLYDRWQPVADPLAAAWPAPPRWDWQPALDAPQHAAGVARIKEAIARGETYQVNYTYPLRATVAGDPWDFARALWAASGGGFGAWLDTPERLLISASPELFFDWEAGRLTARPMKGTRPRGRTPDEDRALAAELTESEKDRAENLMILDMLRNDLGRVAATGSVEVPARFSLERYEQVWQLTSTVTARTTAGFGTILAALFPCASITGAPKARTMQWIADLETAPRGAYCGAIGHLDPGRRARFSVAIRTAELDAARQQATYGVGGGIVWDSEPAAEWAECAAKSSALHRRQPRFELLETLLWEPGSGYLLEARHHARLAASADYFGFACDLTAVRRALAPAGWSCPQRVRLVLARSGALEVTAVPFDPGRARCWSLALAAAPVDSQDRFLYHKTTHRAVYEAAQAGAPEGAEVLLYNERGELTESSIANVVVQLAGQRYTPPLRCGLLAGCYRALALQRGWVRERVITLAELPRVEGCWLLNSVRRVRQAGLG
ncbi:MAG: aminodeoxychorismate synthase component I [Fimbriimonadaceae bacterium]|nr:aminodeoxychorismate synthase component I [Fimbriimonadaceae bacterium]